MRIFFIGILFCLTGALAYGRSGHKPFTTSGTWFSDSLQGKPGEERQLSQGRVLHVSMAGDDNYDGTVARPFATISKGAELAMPGDTVLVHQGTYRERVAPPRGGLAGRPITYMAAENEKVYVKGSDVWEPDWRAVSVSEGIYEASLDGVNFGNFNPYEKDISMFELMASSSFYQRANNAQADQANNTSKDIKIQSTEKYTLGQVFINGNILPEVLNKDEVSAKKGSWCYQREKGTICVNFPEGITPENAFVELTVRNRIFAPHKRGLGYIQVIGFNFEACANDAICLPHMVRENPEMVTGQQGAVSTRSGHHWTIRDNTIRFAKTVGMDIGSEGFAGLPAKDYETIKYPTPPIHRIGFHLIKNNIVSDNGLAGIMGISFNDTRIIGNIVERNNTLLYTGHQHAGIKMLLVKNCQVDSNFVRDNECIGIWLDNQVDNSTIRNNVCINNTRTGIFYEVGKGPVLIRDNYVSDTRKGIKAPVASGIMLSDSRGVLVENNTLVNNGDVGICIRLIPGRKSPFPTRSGLTEAKDIIIRKNRLYQNKGGFIEMPYPGSLSDNIRIDSNVYAGRDVFSIMATGERVHTEAGVGASQRKKDRAPQKKKILDEYQRRLDKEPTLLNPSNNISQWRLALTFREWQQMMGYDPGATFIPSRPNIVYIMADDLGYGDLQCYNKEGKIPTPNIDELARNGVMFGNAHSSDALCTPSRYSVLTGNYCWRTKLKKGVIFDYSQPLIERGEPTIASFLKGEGYNTAAFGKWHQGFDWKTTEGEYTPFRISSLHLKNIDFNRDFTDCPLDHGFDYYFGIPGSNDMGPYLYIENRRVVGDPSIWATKDNFPFMRGKREGWMTAGYKLSQLDSNFTEKAKTFIRQQDSRKPFFMYYAASAPHFPYDVPDYARGKTGAGPRGDMIWLFDYMVGEIVKTLKEQGVYDNTMIVITSDNGPLPGVVPPGTSPEVGVFETYGHASMGQLKGFKGTVFEGGHRVPLIVSWPGQTTQKRVDDQVCLVDIFGLIGQVVQREIPVAAKDSYGFLPLIKNEKPAYKRPEPIISYAGGIFSIQDFDGWKYIHENQLGGGIYSWKGHGIQADRVGPIPGSQGLLYDLSKDPSETKDLFEQYPEKVKQLSALIQKIIDK